jgi:hypothetical protein
VKHIQGITKVNPARADLVQDIICTTALALASLLQPKEQPILNFINDKCDLPG